MAVLIKEFPAQQAARVIGDALQPLPAGSLLFAGGFIVKTLGALGGCWFLCLLSCVSGLSLVLLWRRFFGFLNARFSVVLRCFLQVIQRVGGIAGPQQPRFLEFHRMRAKKERLFQSRNLFPALDAFQFMAGIM